MYDPTVAFVLELATVLALRDAETVEALAKEVADALQTVIRDSAHVHSVVIGRAAYYLLRLLLASNVSEAYQHEGYMAYLRQDYDFVRAPVVLHTFSKFDQDLIKQCAPLLLKGLSDCINGPSGLRNEMANSPDFWSLLHALLPVTEASADVFRIVEGLITSPRPGITADNYEAAIALLNEFATAGSVGATEEQRRDPAARRGRQAKPKAPQ